MTKDQIIAAKDAEIARLLDIIDRLTLPKELGASTERTRRWRERHSDGHGNGHSDVTPSPKTPPYAPIREEVSTDLESTGRVQRGGGTSPERHRNGIDEVQARSDAIARGFSEPEFTKHFCAWKDYGAQVGWRSKAGPWKDYNAAFRTWLGHENPSGNGVENGHDAVAEQEEVDRINAEADELRARKRSETATVLQ